MLHDITQCPIDGDSAIVYPVHMRYITVNVILVLIFIVVVYGTWIIVSASKHKCADLGGTLIHPGICIRAERIDY
jgi:hypothetical protein